MLKKIITEDEWYNVKSNLYYDFVSDSYFSELKDAEILKEKLELLNTIKEYEGDYFDRDYIKKRVLGQTDHEIQQIEDGMDQDKKEKEENQDDFDNEDDFDDENDENV